MSLLADLRAAGVSVSLSPDGKLHLKNATEALIARARADKDALIEQVRVGERLGVVTAIRQLARDARLTALMNQLERAIRIGGDDEWLAIHGAEVVRLMACRDLEGHELLQAVKQAFPREETAREVVKEAVKPVNLAAFSSSPVPQQGEMF